jgi:hypothetical protein
LPPDQELADRIKMEGKARCHWSAELKDNYDSYVRLIRKLKDIGSLRFDFSGVCVCACVAPASLWLPTRVGNNVAPLTAGR